MLVSGGYPESYAKGKEIRGTEKVHEALVFHAGTRMDGEKLVTAGGRVMALTAYGKDLDEALSRSNAAANAIQFEGKNFRRDIGFDV
jgi:phosphoribosylamine--glycine ligase